MTDKAKEIRRAYKRKWAKENPDKVREHQARYWEKKAAAGAAIEPEAQNTGNRNE